MTVFIDSHSILDVTDQLKYHVVFGNFTEVWMRACDMHARDMHTVRDARP